MTRLTCEERAERAEIAHILPTVSSDRILITASFVEPQRRRPRLRVNGRKIRGRHTDSEGRFWTVDARRLDPGQRDTLELQIGRCPVSDPWKLSTFPAPESLPEHFRWSFQNDPVEAIDTLTPFHVSTHQRGA
jgi:hypothetical protein